MSQDDQDISTGNGPSDSGDETGSGAASNTSGGDAEQGGGYQQTDDSGPTSGSDSMGDLGSGGASGSDAPGGTEAAGGGRGTERAGAGGADPAGGASDARNLDLDAVTASGKGSAEGAPNTGSSTSGPPEGVTGPEWVKTHGSGAGSGEAGQDGSEEGAR
jgi:hypothetical protein